MAKNEVDIKGVFSFVERLHRFPEIGIELTWETDGIDPDGNKYEGFTTQQYIKREDSEKYVPYYYRQAAGIPEKKLEAYYDKLYIATEVEKPNIKLSTFYKLELKYLQGLSEYVKEQYFGIIDSMTDYLNNKINTQAKEPYTSFDELYKDAVYYGTVEQASNDVAASNLRHYHQFCFNLWLQENKNLKYLDELRSLTLLTKDNWLAYLTYESKEAKNLQKAYEVEKATWRPLHQLISGNITVEQIKKANYENHTHLLNWLSIVNDFEESKCKVQLFQKGNEYFKEQGKLDYNEIEEARKTNTKEVYPHRTRSIIHNDSIYEAEESELETLFQEKFNIAIERRQYKTEATFAKYEIQEISPRFFQYREGIPILNQWFEFLEAKAQQKISNDTKQIEPKQQKTKLNHKSLAFYYYYMQRTDELEWFDNWSGGREEAYKDVTSKHFVKPTKTSWKSFQREYIRIEKETSANRYQLCSKANYPVIMDLLKEHTKALSLAQTELKKTIE